MKLIDICRNLSFGLFDVGDVLEHKIENGANWQITKKQFCPILGEEIFNVVRVEDSANGIITKTMMTHFCKGYLK